MYRLFTLPPIQRLQLKRSAQHHTLRIDALTQVRQTCQPVSVHVLSKSKMGKKLKKLAIKTQDLKTKKLPFNKVNKSSHNIHKGRDHKGLKLPFKLPFNYH